MCKLVCYGQKIDKERRKMRDRREENGKIRKRRTSDPYLLDGLLDPNNDDLVCIKYSDGKTYFFEQVAIMPVEEDLYCLLHPLTPVEGVKDDEVIVFKLVENREGNADLEIERDGSKALLVFNMYRDFIKED